MQPELVNLLTQYPIVLVIIGVLYLYNRDFTSKWLDSIQRLHDRLDDIQEQLKKGE